MRCQKENVVEIQKFLTEDTPWYQKGTKKQADGRKGRWKEKEC